MASKVLTLIVGIAFIGLVTGQSAKKEWTWEEFYNPRTDAAMCGFPKGNYPAYICDPNGYLGDDLSKLNWILADAAYNSTRCPCSTYYCETSRDPKGYKIGVALVKKMTIQRGLDGKLLTPEAQAQNFAYKLKTEKWKLGDCEEDIVIFYSVDDKMLALYTGSTAGMRLNAYYRDLLAFKIGPRLKSGHIVEAMNVLIYDMKTVLNCDAPSSYDCNLYEKTPNSSPIFTASMSFTAFVAVFLVFLSHH